MGTLERMPFFTSIEPLFAGDKKPRKITLILHMFR